MVEEAINRLFYVCGMCGCLVSRSQEHVHDNFHSETDTGLITQRNPEMEKQAEEDGSQSFFDWLRGLGPHRS